MGFEAIERDWTRQRLEEVVSALSQHPSHVSYKLDEFTILDLLKMADVADFEMVLQFKPRNTTDIPDTVPEGW